jgi:type VI secretion system secreted protein VgrG
MFAHTDRPMKLTTPLGADTLLLTAVRGREAISELFHLELETLWQDQKKPLPFDQLLGQKITVELVHRSGTRYFNGIVVKITQGGLDQKFIAYRVEVVPQLWLLTRQKQSRIFQQLNIPDILREVLQGLDVTYEIQGEFQPREYCVQYRETDFNFVSRLMEEEGIYYFFKHTKDGHKLVLANTPQSHPAIPYQTKVVYEEASGHTAEEDRIYDWLKAQEMRAGKYVAWDDCFQMPGKHLEAQKTIVDSVPVGKITHKLNTGGNDKLEIYDFPGGYSRRFDDVDKGGGDQSSKLQKVFTDNGRTVGIRMQQETLPSLIIHGMSGHAGFTAGHTFDLTGHFSDNSKFAITGVEHDARQPMDTDDLDQPYEYRNRFECIPMGLPFRPQQTTPIPSIAGVQTGTVVGPAGEEIYTDKYGRVKVQFHWDRQGKDDIDSSCWMRVGTSWAGKRWGAIHIPRIGQEVIIDFIEGDVDHPIIVGSVYNADMMPPYDLPDNKTQSGIKSRSSKGGGPENFNEIRFEDKKDSEQLFIHAEKNQDIEVEHDETHWVGNDRTKTIDHDETTHVKHDRTETVDNNETITIHGQRTETVDKDETITIHGQRTETVDKDETITIHGQRTETVDKDETITIHGQRTETVNKTDTITINQSQTTTAIQSIELKVGSSSIKLDPSGVTIKGLMITVDASVQGVFKSLMTQVEGSAMTQVKGGIVMIN